MAVDDVAVDFPKLPIILAHAGRPLYMETAVFLARRHPNVRLDLSGIPPKKLLEYLPRLEDLSDKCLWGTDYPSPGVLSMKENVAQFLRPAALRGGPAADPVGQRVGALPVEAGGARSAVRIIRRMSRERVLVVGGGTMGRGIASLCALAGYPTSLYEADAGRRAGLRAAIESSWSRAVEKNRLTSEAAEAGRRALAIPADARGGLGRADRDRGGARGPRAQAARLRRARSPAVRRRSSSARTRRPSRSPRSPRRLRGPERVVGLHFFNPVAAMPLVEIVRGRATSAAAVDARRGLRGVARQAADPRGGRARIRDVAPRRRARASRRCAWSRRASRPPPTSTGRWSSATATGWGRSRRATSSAWTSAWRSPKRSPRRFPEAGSRRPRSCAGSSGRERPAASRAKGSTAGTATSRGNGKGRRES